MSDTLTTLRTPTGRVVGIDPGLTVTTVCAPECWTEEDNFLAFMAPKDVRGTARLSSLQEGVRAFLRSDPALVALEGYSFGSPGKQHAIAEWGGVLRLLLFKENVPFIVVPPSTLKKFATGKGNADKREVAVAVARRWDVEGNEHEVDAYVLYRIAQALEYRSCLKTWPGLTGYQIECLDKLWETWEEA